MDSRRQYGEWHRQMAAAENRSEEVLGPWHRTALRLLPDLTNKKVLEVGCGRGDFAMSLARRYPSSMIVGTDFSAVAIDTAKEKNDVTNLAFQVEDAQHLSFRDNEFDVVVSCECLEHVPAPEAMLSQISRCLKPAGAFVITTENYFNGMILAWINSWLRRKPFNSGSGIQPHENFFLFWRVRRMIQRNGLRVTHMESNHFVWLLMPRLAPDTFFTEDISNPVIRRFCRPFGRHFAFCGSKPP